MSLIKKLKFSKAPPFRKLTIKLLVFGVRDSSTEPALLALFF